MSPTYKDRDILLVRWFDQPPKELSLTAVVLVERDEMPGVFYIKRIQKAHGQLYWVEGDNRNPEIEPLVNDSRSWGYLGANEIRGRVLFRVGKRLRN